MLSDFFPPPGADGRVHGEAIGCCPPRQHLNLGGLFRFVDGGVIRQTKVAQLRRMCESGWIPARALMIGDRNVDLVAGRTCGLAVGGVLWGYGSLAELEREAPEHLFTHPSDWQELVD
jgi:phosphoglycolate phosphatase-like HAD superfamily hydrolase